MEKVTATNGMEVYQLKMFPLESSAATSDSSAVCSVCFFVHMKKKQLLFCSLNKKDLCKPAAYSFNNQTTI